MSKYEFVKVEEIRRNNRNVNVYDVYQNDIEEDAEIREECERPGVTVVTGISKITRRNKIDRCFFGQTYGKNKREAEENFFMSNEDSV